MTSNFNDSDLYQYPPFNQHRADPIWNRDSDYLVPVVSSVGNGPKGDKGDPLVFDNLTDEQMQKVLQDANYVGNKAEEATYITGSGTTSVIEIPIADFDQFDMLFVDIEGLDLHEGADYDIVGNNIILNTPITHSGTKVHFKALSYTLIDGDKTIQNIMGHHDYDTVATMKLDTDIELGAICHTLGFNAKGDKGAAWYKVTDDAIATETDVISLDNGYYAIMYKDDESVNPEMLGVFDYTLTEWAGTTRSYSKRTVVYWGSSAYTARQDVPTGIQITNAEYWVPWVGNEALHLELERIDDNLIKKAFAFDTVADMKACNELYAGAICHTNGFHTSGDGGSAWYKITDIGTANEMDVIACGDLFANLIWDGTTVNIQQIGAHADNVTNDAPYFKRAVAMILANNPLEFIQRDNPKGGGVVYIPTGNYLFAGSITNSEMTSNIKFIGESKTTVIINCSNPIINLGAGEAHWNIEFRDISFIGNAISCITANNMIVSNCRFYNATEFGIRLYLTVNVKIEKCYFTNCEYGIIIASVGSGPSTTLDINGCWFSHNKQGVFCQFPSNNGLYLSTIRNSIFEYNNRALYMYGNSGAYPTRLVINNIHFEGNSQASILNNISFKMFDCYYDDALASDDTLTELFQITSAIGNVIEIDCDTIDRFTIANRWLGKFYVKDNENNLFDSLYNNELTVKAKTYTVGQQMIATNGTVEVTYMSSDMVAYAFGVFVRGTALTLQNLLTDRFVTNANGVIQITDDNGQNPLMRIKWISE